MPRSQALQADGALAEGLDFANVEVAPPRDAAHGDLACNAALVLAKAAKTKPRDIADKLAGKLEADADIERIEVAGPGFLNLSFRPAFWHGVVAAILQEGADYGRVDLGRGERIDVEYVSPTRPARCMSATAAARCSAMRSPISCSSPATR